MNSISPDLKAWIDIIQWLITIGLAIAVWLRKPGEDAGKAVELLRVEFTGRVQLVDTKIATIEERMHHMPTSEELSDLKGKVMAMDEKVNGISDGMRAQTGQLSRIEQFLLNGRMK